MSDTPTPEQTEEQRNAEHNAKMAELKRIQDAEVRSKTEKRGLTLVHTGDGKGKSTAAFGLALRAAGNGFRVCVVQFTKGSWKTGEGALLKTLPGVDHLIVGDGFTWNTQDRAADIASAKHGWQVCVDAIEQSRGPDPKYHLIIMDELNIVLRYDYLPIEPVVEAVRNKPRDLHLCITGRDAKPELIEVADTVTEFKKVKHAYEAGVRAMRGIEF